MGLTARSMQNASVQETHVESVFFNSVAFLKCAVSLRLYLRLIISVLFCLEVGRAIQDAL
jgi:hypothetical protein